MTWNNFYYNHSTVTKGTLTYMYTEPKVYKYKTIVYVLILSMAILSRHF